METRIKVNMMIYIVALINYERDSKKDCKA